MSSIRIVTITELRRKMSAIFTEIESKRVSITITRFGKPIAVLDPAPNHAIRPLRDRWKAKARIVGDIINTNWSVVS